MQSLSHHQIVILLLQLSIMLILGKLLGEVAKKLKQPAVIGEIIAGIILGPTVLGTIFPEIMIELFPKQGNSPIALHGLTSVSVILLLFIAGLEVELPTVIHQGKKALLNSFLGISISFTIGFCTVWFYPSLFNFSPERHLIYALFIGTALSITALPIIARTLMDLGIFKSHIGLLIVASAMMDDLIGWIIFSIILGMMDANAEGSVLLTVIATVGFAALMLTIGRRLLDRFLPWINHRLSFPGGILSVSIALCFLGAAFTEYIGIHAIFGAFIVGVAMGDSIHMSSKSKEIIHDFVTNIFAPLFFVSIGLKVNFVANFDWFLSLLVLTMAFCGKTIGCTLASRISGFSIRESFAIGFGMNARGAMEIILATLALQAGVIDQFMFVALVVMALLTSMSSGYLMKILLPKDIITHNEPEGIVVMGDNEIGLFTARFLAHKKIPVLLVDSSKTKMGISKIDNLPFQANILKKGVIERLDLSRYGQFVALTENDEENESGCKIFAQEFGDAQAFRLISKKESQSASLSLPENILFRGIHWHYSAVEKIIKKNKDLEVNEISFDSEASLNKFITFNNNKKQIIPLFILQGKRKLKPVSSKQLEIEAGDKLLYIDIHRQIPKSIKPKVNNFEKTMVEK